LYLRPGAVTGRRRLAGTVVPVLAIASLGWVLTHSTLSEFLAVGVVLAVGCVLYAIVRSRSRGERRPAT